MTRGAAACLAILILALGTAAAQGCGDGDDDAAMTTPTTEPATPTGPTGPGATDGDEAGKEKSPGDEGDVGLQDGTVSPPPETDPGSVAAPEDSPENDIPPAPGSPAEQFEEYCDANPEACG